MLKNIVFLVLLNYFGILYSQSKYPTNDFINPLKVPLVLSGSFGELRSNHFHAGLDIKTQHREGLSVYAAADGYVSRINVALWGYGNALYITHPNGYTTVYGHLKKFSPEIEAFVRKKQYAKESFIIKLFPKKDQLSVKQGDIIALSGNSGSSGGPHLHFEIRDTKANILNPLQFGIKIPDHKKPFIQSAFAYAEDSLSQINKSNKPIELHLKRLYNGDVISNKIYAYGKIGIGINAYDRFDGALNHNGLYDLEMEVNGTKIFQYRVDKFSFRESRFINSYIDYKKLIQSKQRVQKCFVDHKANTLSLYKTLINNGFITIKDTLDYKITITAKDFEGNKTKLTIPVKGRKDTIAIREKIKKTPYFFKANQVNTINDSIVHVYFPKNIFYEDFYFDYSFKDGHAKLHNRTVPVHNYFKISFDISKYSEKEISQMYIGEKNRYGKLNYLKTRRKDNVLYASSKSLGEFSLATDTWAPSARAIGFKDKQWLTKFNTLQIKIYDKGSGIKTYRGTIDGKWILMRFNPKKGILTYNFSDKTLIGTTHLLKLILTDNVNNSTTFTISFNKKSKT